MKSIVWNGEEIKTLKNGHIYNDMLEEVKASAKKLADANTLDEGIARIIVVMLMHYSAYTAINVTKTRVEFKIGSGNADVLDKNCVITAYVVGTKAFRIELKNYLNDLFGYLR